MDALTLAMLSAVCFGAGMVTSRIGLGHLEARSGAAISIPAATLLFVLAAPFAIDWSGLTTAALLAFAAVGLFYPAMVTLLTFRANEELGPTVTSAISGTAPLFAILAAALLLGEHVPAQVTTAALGVAAGVALLSWRPGTAIDAAHRRALFWPVAGAVLRGLAQTGAKAALLLWPNPFAASLVGYLVSSSAVLGAEQLRAGGRRTITRPGLLWFIATGIINGAAMLLMYAALARAPVSTVAPVIAAYPLVTALGSVAFLHGERPGPRALLGALVIVAAIVWLAAHRAA